MCFDVLRPIPRIKLQYSTLRTLKAITFNPLNKMSVFTQISFELFRQFILVIIAFSNQSLQYHRSNKEVTRRQDAVV